MTVFVKRYPEKGEFPKEDNRDYCSNIGMVYFRKGNFCFWDEQLLKFTNKVEWFLEEIELPSEEEIEQESNSYYFDLEEKREKARDFRGQVAGRHPDMLTSREMFSQMSGFVDGVKFLKNLLKQK